MHNFGRESGFLEVRLEVRLEVLWPIWGLLELAILLLKVSRLSTVLTRALGLVWGPIFGHFREKCLRFLFFSDFALKKIRVQGLDFLSKDFLSKTQGLLGACPPAWLPVGPIARPPRASTW